MKKDNIEVIYEENTEIGFFCLYKEDGMFFVRFKYKEDSMTIKGYNLYGPYDENKVLKFLFKEFVDKANFRIKLMEKFYEMHEYADKMTWADMPEPNY